MKSIWVPISGQIAQQQKVDTIANNIANANTIGFKKDDLIFKEYLEAEENPSLDINIPHKDFSPQDMYQQQGAQKSYVAPVQSFTDFSQGQLTPTGNPLDLGIQGEGFFEVLTPQGIRYTRNGSFTLNQQGELVTENNFKLLAKSPNSLNINSNEDPQTRVIKITPNQTQVAPITVNKSGDLFQGENKINTISVLQVNAKEMLRKEGDSLYYLDLNALNNSAQKDNVLSFATNNSIEQGFLEGSNVNPIDEISELIKAHRQFDQIQKAVQAYDSINSKAMNDLMKF